ncbi:hypothetical protein A0J61_06811 [Choanephora cucurbitarum]|uniref:Uncharacterized protein n=1 Tax=Choanephora cucurbitarum TaxID=101091 RepID=A0A1C7N7L2_9FUNG|nr:hypothetical protein A0J61_06811 [Choanephora cucurbitarum]
MFLTERILVTSIVSSAIFNITRLVYTFAFSITTTIIFSKLPGGSSTRFWYEQQDLLGKVMSYFFYPSGPTGTRGVKSTNTFGIVFLIITLALNFLPMLLEGLSPKVIVSLPGTQGPVLSPISNIFIPTLNEISLPHLSVPSKSKNATEKFLCSHIEGGCLDASNHTVAEIIWDAVDINPVKFYRDSSQDDLLVSFGDSFVAATVKPQFLQLAKDTLGSQTQYTTGLSFKIWNSNNLTGFISNAYAPNLENTTFGKYDILNSDQLTPLDTPDLSEMLKQGRRKGEPLPRNGSINRAERWTAIHRTSTLSSLLWQSVNAHSGTTDADWIMNCFFCQMIGIENYSSEAYLIQESLLNHPNNASRFNTFTIQSYVDQDFRLSTVLCTVEFNRTNSGVNYWCTHTFSQIWNVEHSKNPIDFYKDYNGDVANTDQFSDLSSTPFPYYPVPKDTENRTSYIPVVPIFEIRSIGQCRTDWNFRTQTLQSWMKECASRNLGQLTQDELKLIAGNIWQIASTITTRGFLINVKHWVPTIRIHISLAAIIVIGAGVGFFVIANLVYFTVINPAHRRSLYESIRHR